MKNIKIILLLHIFHVLLALLDFYFQYSAYFWLLYTSESTPNIFCVLWLFYTSTPNIWCTLGSFILLQIFHVLMAPLYFYSKYSAYFWLLQIFCVLWLLYTSTPNILCTFALLYFSKYSMYFRFLYTSTPNIPCTYGSFILQLQIIIPCTFGSFN